MLWGMAPSDNSGRITLHRVPRRFAVALLAALAMLLVQLFGLGEHFGEAHADLYIERGLEGLLLLSTYMGWAGLTSWLKDPERSVID